MSAQEWKLAMVCSLLFLGTLPVDARSGTQSSEKGELIASISFVEWLGVRYLRISPVDGAFDNYESPTDDPDSECNDQHTAKNTLVVVTDNPEFSTMFPLILSGLAIGGRLKFIYQGCLTDTWYPHPPLVKRVILYAP